MKKITIRLKNTEFDSKIKVYKDDVHFFTKSFEDELTACEYAGWLEAFYITLDVTVAEVIL